MADDHFHEIQLSGKQLVFLFMATAVVAVVIFLTGVMVGRGVASARGGLVSNEAFSSSPSLDHSGFEPEGDRATPGVPATPPASGAAASPPGEEFSYYDQLEGQAPKPAAAAVAVPVTPENDPVVGEPAVPAGVAGQAMAGRGDAAGAPPREETPPPAGGGGAWAVQVAALTDRRAADSELAKLLAKGYAAYLVPPAPGARVQAYRVRVGRFGSRAEAEAMRRRLEKDQYKPMITR